MNLEDTTHKRTIEENIAILDELCEQLDATSRKLDMFLKYLRRFVVIAGGIAIILDLLLLVIELSTPMFFFRCLMLGIISGFVADVARDIRNE